MVVFEELPVEYQNVGGMAVAVDEHYTVRVNGRRYASLTVNPQALRELTVGLLLGGGLISHPSEVLSVVADAESREVHVQLGREVQFEELELEDCGAAAAKGVYVRSESTFALSELLSILGEFNRAALKTTKLLAVHSSAIVEPEGRRGVIAHDPSRHAATLKALGAAILRGFRLSESVALTTGRASSDIVIDLARAGIPVLVSLKGPLMSGLRAAELLGLTLVLSVRGGDGGRMLQAVTHAWRTRP